MEHLVDLDVLADRLRPVIEQWRHAATVGPLTWRDETASWPQPITPDRADIQAPESLGLTLHRHDDLFEMVVWTGGWADVGYLLNDEIHNSRPEFHDVEAAYAAVVEQVEIFLA
ncbi:hypothetical protein [Actinokineospora diospyrosa]|uniref:hypothetical protein n=1 Tax=Actinokineospora diospyrosa TaxID=103728 RepID=UPI0020A3A61C|nr:hypothetical protein [Actinokineospora diospyrosa]